MNKLYLIGRSNWYAQWVTEKVMLQFARSYYERLLEINRPKNYVVDPTNSWDRRYLIPEPIDIKTSIEYLNKNNMIKGSMIPVNELTNAVWDNIVEVD